jgi:hypothetical protein
MNHDERIPELPLVNIESQEVDQDLEEHKHFPSINEAPSPINETP